MDHSDKGNHMTKYIIKWTKKDHSKWGNGQTLSLISESEIKNIINRLNSEHPNLYHWYESSAKLPAMPRNLPLHEYLRHCRGDTSQGEISRHMGINRSSWNRKETGARKLTWDDITQYCIAVDIKVSKLILDWENSQDKPSTREPSNVI